MSAQLHINHIHLFIHQQAVPRGYLPILVNLDHVLRIHLLLLQQLLHLDKPQLLDLPAERGHVQDVPVEAVVLQH